MPSPHPRASRPRVTVFVAVYNRERFVADAIQSVLGQSFTDFELLIVDDGSTDDSADVAERYADPRIRVVRQEKNLGIPRTRNHGLELARGEYLAILDSDDVAFPRRLEKQVAFLDANPRVAAVGGWARRVHRDGRRALPAMRPTEPRKIRARIPFVGCFKNPTMMGRTNAMREFGYREEFVICQDIDMWSRMSALYPLANLPEYLIQYRLGGTSHRNADLAARMKKRAAADQLYDLGVDFDESDLDGHYILRNPKKFRVTRDQIAWSAGWLERLVNANRRSHFYPEPEFTKAAAERYWRVAVAGLASGLSLSPSSHPREFRRELPGSITGLGRTAWLHITRRPPTAG